MRNGFIILVILSSLLMQACATTNVVTTTIPGKELSRTSLGVREIDNKVMMEEVDSLSVKLYRRISTAEYTNSVFQAVKETRHERTTYDCRNAYSTYPAFILTTLGVSLLYEVVTGFDILREMCARNPPSYLVETADTGMSLSRESFDKEKVVTRETPIAGEPVTVEIDGNKFVVSTSPTGIATIPEKEIVSLNDSERSLSIYYQYNDVRLAAPYKKRAQLKEALAAKSSAKAVSMNKIFADEPSPLFSAVTTDDIYVVKRSALWESSADSMAIDGKQSAPLGAARESKRQGQGSPSLNGVVTSNGSSKITSPAPDAVAQGTGPAAAGNTVAVITGANVASSSTAVSAGAATVVTTAVSPVPVTVTAGATGGAGSVTVNTDGTDNGDVTDNAPPPVAPPAPDAAAQGTGPAAVNNSGTGFINRANVASSDTGVTSGAATVVNTTAGPVPASTGALNVTGTGSDGGTDPGAAVSPRTTAVVKNEQSYTAAVSIGAESISESANRGEWKIILHVNFDTNKATIKKEYFPKLQEIGETLKKNPRLKGVIEGHTDSIGSTKFNQKLSIRRAGAIAQYLLNNFGISSARLKIEGFGKSRAVADNATPKGRAINRRIEAKFKNLSSSSAANVP